MSIDAEDQTAAGCIQKPSVNAPFGLSENRAQSRDPGRVPETGELLESGLRYVGKSLELSYHEIHDIVGVALGANPVQIPVPSCRIPVETDQPFLGQRGEELDREERIAAGLLVYQLRQHSGSLRLAAQGI